jgi:hypothetical protein
MIGVIHTFSRAACGWATGCQYVLILFPKKMQGPVGGCPQPFNLKFHFLRFSNTIILQVSSFRLRRSAGSIDDWEAAGCGFFFSIGHQVHCTLCSIVPVGGQWIVQCGTVEHGPFMLKGTALRHAFAEAQAVRAKGQPSRVSVQDGSGGVSTEHCLCADFIAVRGRNPDAPYPP